MVNVLPTPVGPVIKSEQRGRRSNFSSRSGRNSRMRVRRINQPRIGCGRPMSRLAFALALGGLAREHGEKLLRVKGLVAFADRPGGPAAIHAVQHTLYPPRWLERWPDADVTSRLVFIIRDLEPDEILRRFAEGEPARIASPAGVT